MGCMLLRKVGTARCEASRDGETGEGMEAAGSGSLVPEDLFRKNRKTCSLELRIGKRAVLLPGRLKVLAWNLIPQRPCTAVTLFAAIPCQHRPASDQLM